MGITPPMVTEAEFELMQEILEPGHTSRPKKEPYQFLLRGMLTCSECGYAIVTEEKTKKLQDGTVQRYRYCHCCDKHPSIRCKNRSIYIREDKLIQEIKDELSKYTIDEDFFKLAIEALAEEDDIEVAKQNEEIANYNQQIAKKKNELDNLRRSVYKGLITDNAFFLSEQESLNKDIEKLQNDRDKVMVAARNWRDVAMDIFMFARYAKEDFDSDDWEKRRFVIKKLGINLKLSGRTIQFSPVKYLVPIEKAYPGLKQQVEAARTDLQQMKKDLKEGLISNWYTL